jgi:hypothetical protein
VTPTLPIRSTAAKNDFAIFIKITSFLSCVHTQQFRQRLCQAAPSLQRPF